MKKQYKIEKENYSLEDLLTILKMLRAPDGCPWDREQTHASVVGNMLEECFEVVDAIEKESDEKLQEELGDVLMQVAFHSVLADERNAFAMQDVLNTLCNKLIYRHTFVFGEDSAKSAQEALEFWEKNKTIEKKQECLTDKLEDLPKVFPSLLRAGKAMKRMHKAGISFVEEKDIYTALYNQIQEIQNGKQESNAIGKLLLLTVMLANQLHISAEEATRKAANQLIENVIQLEREQGGVQDKILTIDGKTI